MPVRVTGLRELNRAFLIADKALQSDLRDALEEAAAPVRSDAQSLAVQHIRRIRTPNASSDWSRMRIGTKSQIVYVAPAERGARGRGNQRYRRRKFADQLMNKAMEPALVRNEDKVIDRVNDALNDMARIWELA